MFAIISCLPSIAILPQNGFRRGCAAAVLDQRGAVGAGGKTGSMSVGVVDLTRYVQVADGGVPDEAERGDIAQRRAAGIPGCCRPP